MLAKLRIAIQTQVARMAATRADARLPNCMVLRLCEMTAKWLGVSQVLQKRQWTEYSARNPERSEFFDPQRPEEEKKMPNKQTWSVHGDIYKSAS
jgi:hypothetical protein